MNNNLFILWSILFIASPNQSIHSLIVLSVHPIHCQSILVHSASASQSIHGQSILVKSIRFIDSPFCFFLVLSSPFYSFLVLSSPSQSFLLLLSPFKSFLVLLLLLIPFQSYFSKFFLVFLSLSQSFIVRSFSTNVLYCPLSFLVRPSPSYYFIILTSPFQSGHSPFLFDQSLLKSLLQFFNPFHCQSFLLLPG